MVSVHKVTEVVMVYASMASGVNKVMEIMLLQDEGCSMVFHRVNIRVSKFGLDSGWASMG